MYCQHIKKEFKRFRFEVKGVTKYHKACQCLDCGERVKSPTGGIWWPADSGEVVADLPDFDLALLDECNKREHSARVAVFQNERFAKHEEYERYLQSDEWKSKRIAVLMRCGYTCEACLSAMATQVHHTNYNSIYSEVLWDLRGVCCECHKKIHGLIA
jgi:hypothetical protein